MQKEVMMDDYMLIAAIRYALLRIEPFIEWHCQEWLLNHWHIMSEQAKTYVRRSVEQKFASDYEQMQTTSWPIVRRLWIGD